MAGIVPPASYRFDRLPWDWDFGVDGALALEPRRVSLQEEAGLGYRAADATRLRHALRGGGGPRRPPRAGRGDWRG